MNEDDLRDCFAMFAMMGMLIKGNENDADIPERSYQFADAMLRSRSPEPEEDGIVSIKPKRKYERKK